MKIFRYIAVAMAAAFIATTAANAQSKAVLQKENTQLKQVIDSLKAEMEKVRAELKYTDSIANEMLSLYADSETKNAGPVIAEEYTTEVSDSLLNLWYVQKKVAQSEEGFYDMDSVRFQSNVPDSVYIERIRQMNSFITLPYNDIVKNYIIKYSEKMPTSIGKILGLSEYYMPIFQEIFSQYDMPEELRAMAVIESAMNPLAVSRVGAKGMWQFMYSTAKVYGLHIDSFVDERLDPIKSAHAAAQYLQDAYEIFGDWNLAIASYNCGAGNVNKAIRRSGGKRGFWDIWPYLPRETRGYVPAFVGALYTMNDYKEHGIRPVAVATPAHVDTMHINKMLHLKQVSELTGAPLEDLKNLNPQYRHEIIPGNEREYILRIPYTYTNAFLEYEDSLYRHKADVYFNPVTIKKIKDGGDGERIVYRVKSGDYLGKIAINHGTTVAKIKKWNNLTTNDIRVGQRLIINRGGKAPASTSTTKTTSTQAASKPAAQTQPSKPIPAGTPYIEYTVQSGESLYLIAKKFPGVSAQNIMDFNGIGSNIKPGMKLKIPQL
ncbi:MAG: transglycosylase SLT domain-containing protein [Bacteroidales bacterium]|nr:transglycosylase SLT domain-containing protein [Bacteroidales bacterium]